MRPVVNFLRIQFELGKITKDRLESLVGTKISEEEKQFIINEPKEVM